MKELLNCLEYCKEQNGRDDCKNCGLDMEMIKRAEQEMMERVRGEFNLPELLRLEKKRDEEYKEANIQYKYHPSTNNLEKMKLLEGANGAYISGIRQGKIEVLTLLSSLDKEIINNKE